LICIICFDQLEVFGHGACIILSRKYLDLIMFDFVVDLIISDDDDEEISIVFES
jgi:hypothetical protein